MLLLYTVDNQIENFQALASVTRAEEHVRTNHVCKGRPLRWTWSFGAEIELGQTVFFSVFMCFIDC